MTIDDAFYERMAGGTAITAIVGDRIYLGWREQTEALPCITFFRVDTQIQQSSAGRTHTERARIQVDMWGDGQRDLRTLADAVKARLDGWTHESDPAISSCSLLSEICDLEDEGAGREVPTHRISQDWALWYYAS
jgi:hypothetical protein